MPLAFFDCSKWLERMGFWVPSDPDGSLAYRGGAFEPALLQLPQILYITTAAPIYMIFSGPAQGLFLNLGPGPDSPVGIVHPISAVYYGLYMRLPTFGLCYLASDSCWAHLSFASRWFVWIKSERGPRAQYGWEHVPMPVKGVEVSSSVVAVLRCC